MAEERRQNIFITLATDGLTLRKKPFDAVLSFPVSEGCIELRNGFVPTDIKVGLGSDALSLEECEKCLADLRSCLKSLGCRLTDDFDMRYCLMSIDGGPEMMMGEFVLSVIVKQ